MIITNTLVSFTRHKKDFISKDDDYEETVNTWFRSTELALTDPQNGWLVLVNHELVVASKSEAMELGYTDCDETIKAVDDEIGFSWRHVGKEDGEKATKDLRAAGLLPPVGWK